MTTGQPAGRGYEIREEIGAGAYGVVYRAYQPDAGRYVAVKTILPAYADHADFAARFEVEAQMVAQLEHPHIVPLYDTWRDERGAHLVMRLLRGGTLKNLLKTGPLEPETAVKLVEQVASALDVAHQQGVIHRDLKPSNILFDEQGNAYLSDFGIAKNLAAEVTLTPTGAVVGTPDYISPEQIRGEELTPQADQYSLGIVLFEVLTGTHPFAGEAIAALFHKHLNEPVPVATSIRPEIPSDVDTVLQKATAKHPADRYPDIVSFSEAFRQVVSPSDQRPMTSDHSPVTTVPSFLDETRELAPLAFVGREVELEQLASHLQKAISGQGGVAFLAGDAGSGKTALMQAFAERSQDQITELLVIQGICNAFSGSGDPFLPFRGAMRMLAGDVEARWEGGTITRNQALNLWAAIPVATRALIDEGKGLINSFVPGDSLVDRLSDVSPGDAYLAQRLRQVIASEIPQPGELEQAAIFGQYGEVLRQVSKESPILMLLDDLQWADSGSISLLFHLCRQLDGARLLVIGAYRPEEIAIGREGARHPLSAVLDELKRELGDVWVDLNKVQGESFVDAFIDTEPNNLGKQFRRKLFSHTGGQALFTVEVLRDLQERGALVQDEANRWIESSTIAWDKLPARVEGVIAARIGRLEEELRDILTVASVEGEDFTAQVVARVQEIQERRLLRTLSVELARRHQLVRERSALRIGKRHLARYRFAHALFQRYLYNDISDVERGILHGEIAAILEELYADRLGEVTVQLAAHYSETNIADKAVKYLLEAGDKAREQYAHQEAIGHYRRALTFLEDPEHGDLAARTMMKLGLTYHQALDFENTSQSYEEGFNLWRQALSTAPAAPIPPAPHDLRTDQWVPPTLDPAMITDIGVGIPISNLFSGVAAYSTEMDVLPDAALSWDIREGGTEYIIRLRDDVYWTDGTPVTAVDFEYAWKRILDPGTESPGATMLYDILGASAYHQGQNTDADLIGIRSVDDQMLVVKLERPTAYFPHLLAHEFTRPVPRHIVAKYGETWSNPENIVTNGPFQLKSGSFMQHKTLVRNPSYHGRFSGNTERVVLNVPDDREESLTMYQDDELDRMGLWWLAPEDMEPTRQKYAEEYISLPEKTTGCLVFNTSEPPLDDRRVRRALAMAFDKAQLPVIASGGFSFPATGGLIPPIIWGHSKGIGLPHELERARDYLVEAGYPNGRGLPPITFLTPPELTKAVEVPADRWRRDLGIEVKCQVMEWYELKQSTWDSPLHHVEFHPWGADYPDPDNFMRVFMSLFSPWKDEIYWDLIEKARGIQNLEERISLYREADRLLIEAAVVVPLMYLGSHLLIKPWVRNSWAPLVHHIWKDVVIEPH